MKLHHLDLVIQSDILTQGQLHELMSDIEDSSGLASYSNGEVTFFTAHAKQGNWITKIKDIGFVETIYRRYPGIDGAINTPQKLCNIFYPGQYIVYDAKILKEIIRPQIK